MLGNGLREIWLPDAGKIITGIRVSTDEAKKIRLIYVQPRDNLFVMANMYSEDACGQSALVQAGGGEFGVGPLADIG